MGFSIGGLLKSVINPMTIAQLAMGPAGWASLLAQTVVKELGSQLLQKMGQELGLPQGLIDTAVGAFSGGSGFGALGGLPGAGNFRETLRGLGMSFSDIGRIERQVQSQVKGIMEQAKKEGTEQSIQDFIDGINRNNENQKLSRNIDKVMNGKGSLLMKLAVALGMLADNKMNQMADKTKQLGKFGEVNGKNQGQYAQLTGEIQALGQEMSMISQAMNNVIKTVGEAASSLARKG